jgi:hypothetical protein
LGALKRRRRRRRRRRAQRRDEQPKLERHFQRTLVDVDDDHLDVRAVVGDHRHRRACGDVACARGRRRSRELEGRMGVATSLAARARRVALLKRQDSPPT